MTEKLRQYDIYRKMLAAHFHEPENSAMNKVAQFEQKIKQRFIEQPGQMRLLIVVDKLLTGFDAPSATYLYIDKQMRDHGLFQAICRVNRLDGTDKQYGYVIDYKDLFKSLEKSIRDYTGEAFEDYDKADIENLLQDRIEKGRERLEEMRESIKALCEAVEPPQDTSAYMRYFCGSSADDNALQGNEGKRLLLYKYAASLLRAYANLANDLEDAGYSSVEIQEIKEEVQHYEKVRETIMRASSDYVDLKQYEPDMRYLIDNYIRAEESETVSSFNNMTLVELIVERGEKAVDSLPEGIRENPEAMAETIEHNVRRLIIDEMAVNPRYYEEMSELLDALIQTRKEEATDYRTYLEKIVDLINQIAKPETQSAYPASINTPARRALYDNLKKHAEQLMRERYETYAYDGIISEDTTATLAVKLDETILNIKKAGWRGNYLKEREVRIAIKTVLGKDDSLVDTIFDIVRQQRDY